MPKYDYLKSLVEALSEDKLRSIVESFAKQDKTFEAFLIEKSGKSIDTGKSYLDFKAELSKLKKKCQSRKGFFKVTRLSNAGLTSYIKTLEAHFSNENFETSLWMSLALIEMMQEVILMNTKYRTFQKPYKTFEKILLEARDRFDTCMSMVKPKRKKRQHIFESLLHCWWREQLRAYEYSYFEIDDLFRYSERDEDLMTLQLGLQNLKEKARKIDEEAKNSRFAFKRLWGEYFNTENNVKTASLTKKLEKIENRIKKELDEWG